MKIIFLSFFSFIFNNLFCQITIVNEYKLPIAFVNLSDNNQTVLVKSDWSGSVEWSKLKGVGENDTLYFNHASYNSQWILKKNINHNDTIILTEKNYIFSEVVVTANQKPKKYQTINACYRSYQTNNDSLIYYTDGSVEYLTKTKKNKYDKRLKEYRVYQDSLYLTNLKERKISANFKLARTPPPLTDYLPKHFFKSNSLSLSKNISGSFDILTKDNIKIGTVKKDSNYVTYYIDDIFSCITRDFTKYEAIQLKSDVTLIFKVSENNEHLLIDNFDNLVYSKIYRKYNFKHASEKKYTEIENVEEIFVEEVNFSNEVETDKYNNGFGFPQKSNFSTPFWQKCNCELYQIPPYSSLLLKP